MWNNEVVFPIPKMFQAVNHQYWLPIASFGTLAVETEIAAIEVLIALIMKNIIMISISCLFAPIPWDVK